ncbi:MAG: CsgG/HfaB family protein [Planctomycetota bacterium]
MKNGRTHILAFLVVICIALTVPNTAAGQGLRVSGQPVRILQANKENHAIAFSPDGKYLAVGGEGDWKNPITIFEMPLGQQRAVLIGHTKWVTGLVFTLDSRFLISGSNDKTVRVWEVASGAQVRQAQDIQEVHGIAYAAGGKIMVSGGKECAVTIWDADTLAIRGQGHRHGKWVQGVAMTPDGALAASASDDGTIAILDLARGGVVRTLQGSEDEVLCVAISPDGKYLACGCEDESVKAWTLPDFAGPRAFVGHGNDVISITYSADGRYLASGSRDHSVIVWDADTGMMVQRMAVDADPWSLAFSPDGKLLAVGTSNKGVLLYALEGAGPGIVIAGGKPTGPSIELLNPDKAQMDTDGPKIMVTGVVSDPEGITRVSINGLDAQLAEPTPEDVQKFGKDHKLYRFIGEALLVQGENRVQIAAIDANGNVTEKMILVNRLIGTVDADGTPRLTQTATVTRTEPVGGKIKIAVLDLGAQGVTPVTAQVLSESLRTTLFNSGRFRVMNREDVDKVLKEKAFEQTGEFANTSSDQIAKMGSALGVEKMVTGSIGLLGRTYAVNLRMVDVASHENERIVSERYNGPEDGLFQTIEAAARKLVAGY